MNKDKMIIKYLSNEAHPFRKEEYAYAKQINKKPALYQKKSSKHYITTA